MKSSDTAILYKQVGTGNSQIYYTRLSKEDYHAVRIHNLDFDPDFFHLESARQHWERKVKEGYVRIQ